MAINVTTSYETDYSLKYYSEILLGAKTPKMIASAGSMITKVKNKLTIPNLEVGQVLQDDSCTFSASGDITMDEKPISVCDMKINMEWCKTTLETSYESTRMTAGAMNSDVPADLQTYIMDRVKLKAQNELENLTWKGDTDITGSSYLGLCDGYFKKFAADSAVIDVAGTTVTASNVLAELQKTYTAIPNDVWEKHNLGEVEVIIMVSTNVARAYTDALATSSGNANFIVTEATPLKYKGIKVESMHAFSDNKMVATYLSNLWVANDLIEDFDELLMIDMSKITGDDNVRVKGRMKYGLEYAYGKYIVYYTA